MNILVLSSKYPDKKPIKGFTPVVHYFAKEWANKGHNVKVIHTQSKFPLFLYWIPGFITKKIENKLGFTFPKASMNNEGDFILDKVSVSRYLLFRVFPYVNYFKFNLKHHIDRIVKSNIKDDFMPDVIISHFLNPQIYLTTELKKIYKCKTSMVVHGTPKNLNKYFKEFSNIDVLGFRSLSIRDFFLKEYSANKHFMCYSGIDEKEILNISKNVEEEINTFIFVGVLIKRKFPDAILHALSKLPYSNFTLSIIGDGPEKTNLNNIIKEKRMTPNVKMHGHVDRRTVMNMLEQHQCFIMISENEVFGLVYIEAMAKGCIVIASKNEGMQGVIENNINGFLCEAGNAEELLSIITKINNLSKEQRSEISLNAISTAKQYTEQNVANDYLQSVVNL